MDIIDRFTTVKECPECKGQGYMLRMSTLAVPCKDPNRKIRTMVTVECVCKKNERIERKYPALRPSVPGSQNPGVPMLSEEEVKKIAVDKFHLDKGLRTNYKFFGNPEKFFRIVKASFLYLLQDASARFYMGTGYEVIKDYYVGADDRKDYMSLLNDFDLVVLLFDSRVSNKAMKPAIMELVQTRYRKGLATWVWSEGDITQVGEWSDDIAQLVNDPQKFCYINLVPTVKDSNVSVSQLMGDVSFNQPVVS